jgi:15-cis-phytoene synthase
MVRIAVRTTVRTTVRTAVRIASLPPKYKANTRHKATVERPQVKRPRNWVGCCPSPNLCLGTNSASNTAVGHSIPAGGLRKVATSMIQRDHNQTLGLTIHSDAAHGAAPYSAAPYGPAAYAPPTPGDVAVTGAIVGALAGAIEQCRAITAKHSSTFYLGSRFFPTPQRHAVWAVYAACRLGDDIADEDTTPAAPARLAAWRECVRTAILEQRPPSANSEFYNMGLALAWAASRFPLTVAPFEELYLGLEMDLLGVQYHSMAELLLYCRRVAGTVGFMIAPIAGYDGGEETLEQALALGIAMQITNVLRDVSEDLGRGRVYLPSQLLAQYGLSRADLERAQEFGQVEERYVRLLQELAALARDHYAQGWRGIPKLHGAARFAVALAAASYEGILRALASQGWNNFRSRAHLSGMGKLALIPGVLWRLNSRP